MYLEQRRQVMLQLHLSDQQFDCLLICVLYYRSGGILSPIYIAYYLQDVKVKYVYSYKLRV